jgi:lysozyme
VAVEGRTVTERQRLVDELVADEGLRLTVYADSKGIPSIGVGRNLRDKGITSREAFDLLDHDVDETIADLAGSFPWFVKLDAVRQRAIVNFRFNVGPKTFRAFKQFLAAMAKGDYDTAAEELVDSDWYAQVQKSRRERICWQIKTGADV